MISQEVPSWFDRDLREWNETDGNDNMNEKDEKMQTPFHVTMITASDAICDLLWKRGADVHTRDMDDYGKSYKIRISLGPL